jgi:hypothetical protein
MTAVCQPHPSVSQKMETRKAGIAMIKNPRFIFAAFLGPHAPATLYALPTLLRPARSARHTFKDDTLPPSDPIPTP